MLSNKVCVCWDVKLTPLDNIIINIGMGLKMIPLKFGTLFGACFKCNEFPIENKVQEAKEIARRDPFPTMREVESTKQINKALPFESYQTSP